MFEPMKLAAGFGQLQPHGRRADSSKFQWHQLSPGIKDPFLVRWVDVNPACLLPGDADIGDQVLLIKHFGQGLRKESGNVRQPPITGVRMRVQINNPFCQAYPLQIPSIFCR